jgi:hypothetical protein
VTTPKTSKFSINLITEKGIYDMTSSLNVKSSSPLEDTRNCKDPQNSGVATQKAKRRDVKKVKVLVTVIYDIMKIYGYGDERGSDRSKAKAKSAQDKSRLEVRILQFVTKAGIGSWKDFFKYKINAFFSWVMDQEIPPVPKGLEEFTDLLDPSFLAYGRGKRFLFNMRSNRTKLESFAQSVAQSKKGAPAVSETAVSDAEYACFEHLTSEHPDKPDFIIKEEVWEHPINRNTICYQLRRTVREIFRGKVPTWDELTKPFVPSTSSQYNFSRGGLGAIGAFLENERIQTYEKKVSFISKSLGPVTLKKELTDLYGSAGIEDQERIDHDFENIMVKGTIGLHFNGEELCELWKNSIYPHLLEEALLEQPRTIVIGLPEPLKVRCITAGPPLTYTVLKPIQQWLWRTLKTQSVFQLIGTPVSSELVMKQLGRLEGDEFFVSGDYKASTDNLHSWVSECLLDELIIVWKQTIESQASKDQFSFEIDHFATLMRRALTGHLILNPMLNVQYRKDPTELRDSDFLPQKEGQLMGSIISFPFLCLANAALCRYSMEITDNANYRVIDREIEGYTLARLLINGDDCVFPGKRILFANWKLIAGFGGLESSVGKTFLSKKFLTINSVQYSYSVKSSNWEDMCGMIQDYTYTDVKYVNLGLVYAQKKNGDKGKPFYRLGAVHRDLQKTCPAEYFESATKLFLKKAKEHKFRKVTGPDGKYIYGPDKKPLRTEDFFGSIQNAQVPYFLPEWLGGLGLIPTRSCLLEMEKPSREDGHVSDMRRQLLSAGWIRDNFDDNRPKPVSDESEWQFHRLVDKSLEDYAFLDNQKFEEVEYQETTRILSDEYMKYYTLAVVDSLLCNETQILIEYFEKDAVEKKKRETHFKNVNLWKKASVRSYRSDCSHTLEEFKHEKKVFSMSCFDVRTPKVDPIYGITVAPEAMNSEEFDAYLASLPDVEGVGGDHGLYD